MMEVDLKSSETEYPIFLFQSSAVICFVLRAKSVPFRDPQAWLAMLFLASASVFQVKLRADPTSSRIERLGAFSRGQLPEIRRR